MPFGVLPTARRPITSPSSNPSPTSFVYTFPSSPPFNHITIFLLPDVTLPEDTGAAVYLSIPPPITASSTNVLLNPNQAQQPSTPQFHFLGALVPGKDSAVFRINGVASALTNSNVNGISASEPPEVDMDAPEPSPSNMSFTTGTPNPNIPQTSSNNSEITIGIAIESLNTIANLMSTAGVASSAQTPALNSAGFPSSAGPSSNLRALPPTVTGVTSGKLDEGQTILLARRIAHNAFNYLASFERGGMVPLKAFDPWLERFERKVKSDPNFLEKDEGQDGAV